jgi:ankyrin repeat protein
LTPFLYKTDAQKFNSSALLWAAKLDEEATALHALNNGANVNTTGMEPGITALALAAEHGHAGLVKLLLNHGADPNRRSWEMWPVDGYDEVASLLLKLLQIPLHYDIPRAKGALVSLLQAQQGIDTGWREMALDVLARNGLRDLVFPPDRCWDMTCVYGHWDQTPLLVAAQHGHIETVKVLLSQAVDVNCKDASGCTALLLVTGSRYLSGLRPNAEKMVELLLSSEGIEADCKDNCGRTPLLNAAKYGTPKIVKMLLDRGADPNHRDSHGQTALVLAVEASRFESMRVLLSLPITNPLVQGSTGITAVGLAARDGQVDMVRFFIERPDIDPDTRHAASGQTLLSIAASRGEGAVVKLL